MGEVNVAGQSLDSHMAHRCSAMEAQLRERLPVLLQDLLHHVPHFKATSVHVLPLEEGSGEGSGEGSWWEG